MEQGNVFRHTHIFHITPEEDGLNPFGTGQCLSTQKYEQRKNKRVPSQSLWNRAMSFDVLDSGYCTLQKSQSLWNRAMSFDKFFGYRLGQVVAVSIPLEQGNVFRPRASEKAQDTEVSIPLEQGNVFRHNLNQYGDQIGSQSLWNRAMSFDEKNAYNYSEDLSQSLWNRAMSFDSKKS